MALHHHVGGPDGPAPRLVLAHGFTQNARCWGRFDGLLRRWAEVVTVDAPGHGASRHDDADLPEAAELLIEVGGPAIYIGYSMGGRTALHAALQHPDEVRGLVLIGATAGIDDPAERAARRKADERLADQIMADGLPAFIDRWLAGPLFAGLTPEQSGRSARLTNRPEGLAASLRRCGTGTQEPLWDRLDQLRMPVLLLVGDEDHKFTAIATRMAAAMTGRDVSLVSLPGTHAVHLEQPDRAAQVVADHATRWVA